MLVDEVGELPLDSDDVESPSVLVVGSVVAPVSLVVLDVVETSPVDAAEPSPVAELPVGEPEVASSPDDVAVASVPVAVAPRSGENSPAHAATTRRAGH